jgi:hypothetical protein
MVRQPAVHSASTTVAEIRAFFADDHVHMALLVDDGELVGALERADSAPAPITGRPHGTWRNSASGPFRQLHRLSTL